MINIFGDEWRKWLIGICTLAVLGGLALITGCLYLAYTLFLK